MGSTRPQTGHDHSPGSIDTPALCFRRLVGLRRDGFPVQVPPVDSELCLRRRVSEARKGRYVDPVGCVQLLHQPVDPVLDRLLLQVEAIRDLCVCLSQSYLNEQVDLVSCQRGHHVLIAHHLLQRCDAVHGLLSLLLLPDISGPAPGIEVPPQQV